VENRVEPRKTECRSSQPEARSPPPYLAIRNWHFRRILQLLHTDVCLRCQNRQLARVSH
jgi:hypothetical protein